MSEKPDRPGRPTKLTPELIGEIAAQVEVTGKPTIAAKAVNISYQTYLNWLERGKKEQERFAAACLDFEKAITEWESRCTAAKTARTRRRWERQRPAEPQVQPSELIYLEFFEAVEQAKANCAGTCMATIYGAAQHDPVEAWRILERLFPDEYKPQPAQVEVKLFDLDDWKQKRRERIDSVAQMEEPDSSAGPE